MDERRFILAGDVIGVDTDHITMQTVEIRPSGRYPDEHKVYLDDTEDIKPGDRLAVMGTITTDPDDIRKLMLIGESVKEHKSKIDMNVARVTGRLDRNFEFFPAVPEEGRRAFGNLLLVVDDEFYLRGVILQAPAAIATHRSEKYQYGAQVMIEGRIQTREFQVGQATGDPQDRVALEVVVNKQKILVPADSTDVFEKFTKETEAAM